VLKVLFTLAVLGFVGRHFARDLSRLDLADRPLHFGWLTLAGLLYLAGLGFSAYFWIRLLRMLGQEPDSFQALRAYYLGHLGKYLPLKAWALIMRVTLVRCEKVRGAVAGLTAFYEVLTTMTSGVLLAALLFGIMGSPPISDPVDWAALERLARMEAPPETGLPSRLLVVVALVLTAVVGLPIVPWVFNHYARRLSLPFQDAGSAPLPHLTTGALVQGLILTAGGWLLLGASLWAVVQSVAGQDVPLTWVAWGHYTAVLSLAYVIGFAVVAVPGGLGVREFFLTVLLAPGLTQALKATDDQARATAVLAVLLLRVVWMAGEVTVAAVIYWFPGAAVSTPTRSVSKDGPC
jgi:hypothetical protein